MGQTFIFVRFPACGVPDRIRLRYMQEAQEGNAWSGYPSQASYAAAVLDMVRLAVGQTQAAPLPTGHGGGIEANIRRGRLTKDESEAKRAQLLATIKEHSSLKDDPTVLARMIGVSESTIRRWIGQEEQAYFESRPARTADDQN